MMLPCSTYIDSALLLIYFKLIIMSCVLIVFYNNQPNNDNNNDERPITIHCQMFTYILLIHIMKVIIFNEQTSEFSDDIQWLFRFKLLSYSPVTHAIISLVIQIHIHIPFGSTWISDAIWMCRIDHVKIVYIFNTHFPKNSWWIFRNYP